MDRLLQKVSPKVRKRLALASLIFWVPTLIFLKLAEDVLGKEPILIDESITRIILSVSSGGLSDVMLVLTHGGDTLFILLATAVLVWLLAHRQRRIDVLAVLFSVGGAGVVNVALKLLFQRGRPSPEFVLVQESGFSFPSGHAMGSSALGLTLVMLFWRTKWRWLVVSIATLYILAIGVSRVYLGAHYPSDVVAGWCVSAVWVLTVYIVLEHPSFVRRGQKKFIHKKHQ